MPHLLNRLELNGFKSFAQKTVFDFPSGITAIVGPNGSGKSNVIDAIRWLLGEREAKNLRGGKGEDLIFAGTAKRARVSQGQASLHFDNRNKFFPVDFSEVTIMRQVNRDGENRYFMNKAEIRLKDLIDFFAKARLGTRGMTVVSQGNSDMFIRASAGERREMIEEMLGLREYQLKRHEAERRLKHTQVNLDKAGALKEEILPHLRSLKRQTGRWERREEFASELRDLENRVFGSELREIEDGVRRVSVELLGYEKEFEKLERGRRSAGEDVKKVEAAQPEERKELAEIKESIHGLLEKRNQIAKDLGRLEAQLELAPQQKEDSLPDARVLLELIERLKSQIELLFRKEAEELQEAIEEMLSEIDDVLTVATRRREGKRRTPHGSVASQFESLKGELEALEKELGKLKQQEQTLEKNQEDFYASFKAAVAALEAAKDAMEKGEAKRRDALFQRERFSLRREEWERQVGQTGRTASEFRGGTAGAVAPDERDALERRMFKLRGDLAAIGEIDAALVTEARETEERYRFLTRESEDLDRAQADLKKLIAELSEKIKTEFTGALHRINEEFNKFFRLMFGGGHARLKVVKRRKIEAPAPEEGADAAAPMTPEEAEEEEEDKIEIDVGLPVKKINSIDMLSGGERSLVGIAALFALISVSPPPFLVLDEVDAALDERNTRRFAEMLKEFSKETQFVIVTHNRATMEAADVLYGVTMNEDATSKVVSLKLG